MKLNIISEDNIPTWKRYFQCKSITFVDFLKLKNRSLPREYQQMLEVPIVSFSIHRQLLEYSLLMPCTDCHVMMTTIDDEVVVLSPWRKRLFYITVVMHFQGQARPNNDLGHLLMFDLSLKSYEHDLIALEDQEHDLYSLISQYHSKISLPKRKYVNQ